MSEQKRQIQKRSNQWIVCTSIAMLPGTFLIAIGLYGAFLFEHYGESIPILVVTSLSLLGAISYMRHLFHVMYPLYERIQENEEVELSVKQFYFPKKSA